MPSLTTDPVIRDAIKLRDGLRECAREWRYYVQMHARSDAAKRMGEHDAKISERAAAMLEKFGIEVSRLRQAIGCFGDGRMSRPSFGSSLIRGMTIRPRCRRPHYHRQGRRCLTGSTAQPMALSMMS